MSAGQRFLTEIEETVLVGDGAIGTELFARGAVHDRGIERLNLLSPDTVLALHTDYVAAGSRVIETNTFAANRLQLSIYGAECEQREIILTGVRLAREAAGDKAYVAGSVGPLPTVEGEPVSAQDQRDIFQEQIALLLEGGVDLLILESFSDLTEMLAALNTARNISKIPVVAQMAFEAEGRLVGGEEAEEVLNHCRAAGANIVGANCGYGIPSITAAIRGMSGHGIPLSAYINAGFPEQVEGRQLYPADPRYLARRAVDLIGWGVHLIGGCCGTGPDTIRAIAAAIAGDQPCVTRISFISKPGKRKDAKIQRPEGPKESFIERTSFPLLVELDPPADLDMDAYTAKVESLKEGGATAVTVADNPMASVQPDSISIAGLLQQRTGLPVLPHLCGRDRNRLALQSAVMGAHLLGIRALLCVTGDPVRMCNEPNTSGVFDLNSISLVRLVAEFNAGRLKNDVRTAFSIGVALNPNIHSLNGQIRKLQRKVEAGAQFALTQPLFEESVLDALQQALTASELKIPVYIGILPLVSARNADFLHNEVPGISVPDGVRQRMSAYDKTADQCAAGMEMMSDLIVKLSSRIDGFYFITPRQRIDLVLPLMSAASSARSFHS
ncbi:MAG: bifunctional homocysteine S-methyltransferase/methylenetetrahydrofolate reductase [bacterium]|nr:bifunctional homocysteine S-methyltransferase/methylenetetrahydrofolate reductase [bacterium]MDD3805854.1 bifunctional homocysteine S-methyltransferase/methylenetetrahydrofolate reductase [bacterium]MDD4153112.1 bifunctional homocysteine S-methyltransferase/methylenetetrahydrofolate reductase [bacterium]MDD4557513.1 bifunctional homocysteine S-methyltransferase/methylenetetrahydrofolate reductase [bacterium]